ESQQSPKPDISSKHPQALEPDSVVGLRQSLSQMLFGAQRQLYHALQQLVSGQSDEIVDDEFLGVEAHQIAQLERLAARSVDEIPVAVVDDDEVALRVEAGAPRLPGRAFEGVARKPGGRAARAAQLGEQFMGDGEEALAGTNNIVLAHAHLDAGEARFGWRKKSRDLILRSGERARSIHDAPLELEVLLDASARPVALQGAQFLPFADP